MPYLHCSRSVIPFHRKLTTWWTFSILEKAWLLPVWLLLGISRATILILPFRHLARHLGRAADNEFIAYRSAPIHTDRARRLSRLIRAVARHTPWDSNCLAQALVARCLLRFHRIPHAVYLGVVRTADGGLAAHAWVDAGPVRVTGGRGSERFTVVKRFTDTASTEAR